MDYELISQTALFQGCSPSETEKLLHGLKLLQKNIKKEPRFILPELLSLT